MAIRDKKTQAEFVPIHIHRTNTDHSELITLITRDYSVTIEVTTRGLELDAATLERVLHAPLMLLVERQCETI